MKLTIRSDTLYKIKSVITGEKSLLSFSFGKMKRSGFSRFIDEWDIRCLKSNLEKNEYESSETKIKKQLNIICDLGFIHSHHLLLYSPGKDSGDNGISYHINESYKIVIGVNSIDINFCKFPTTLTDFFDPVKLIYSTFTPRLIKKEGPKIIYLFNCLWDKKQDFPWILQQGVNYLKKGVSLDDYIVCPCTTGTKYFLFLWDTCGYFVTSSYAYKIDTKVPKSLDNTVVVGYWDKSKFTAYDIVVFKGKDIQKYSILTRLKKLKKVGECFPFCCPVKYLTDDLEKDTRLLLDQHNGVIFSPTKATYINNRTYIFKPIEKTTVRFAIEKMNYGYSLKTGKEFSSFNGTTEYPFRSTIPLTLHDQKFVGLIPNAVFEFRWKNDGFLPIERCTTGVPTSTKNSKKIWSYINNPLTEKMLFNIIKGI
jgi:hypothetical protein